MSEEKYDSTSDTNEHIREVKRLIDYTTWDLSMRGVNHDRSKLHAPEKEGFDKYTPLLKGLTYGSKEYKEALDSLGFTLEHHYDNNSHHPEYYPYGIEGMNLLDLMEMLCDWLAATKRHNDGDIRKSLEINKKRFNIDEQLCNILSNTVDFLEKYK